MNNPKNAVIGATLATLLLGGGLAVGIASSANAATSDPTPTSSSSSTDAADPADTDTAGSGDTADANEATETHDESQGGHVGADGTVETLLTGSTADSVSAAVLAANPGATIERMENDAEGAVYEAHIVLADGSEATVKLDASFAITGTETGR